MRVMLRGLVALVGVFVLATIAIGVVRWFLAGTVPKGVHEVEIPRAAPAARVEPLS